MTFEQWMKRVDAELVARCGLGINDLPDWTYRDAFDAKDEPADVAEEVLADNGFFEE